MTILYGEQANSNSNKIKNNRLNLILFLIGFFDSANHPKP